MTGAARAGLDAAQLAVAAERAQRARWLHPVPSRAPAEPCVRPLRRTENKGNSRARQDVQAGMRDLTIPRAIHIKGLLFVLLGALASALLIVESPRASTVLLLATSVWAFARAYTYPFSVIEHYVDGSFQYSGLGSFVRYLVGRGRVGARWARGEARRRRTLAPVRPGES